MKRKLGIDFGDARIGLALSDLLGWTAQGLETMKKNKSDQDVAKDIFEIAKANDVDTFVIGLPKNMNNTLGERAIRTKEFAELLGEISGIDVVLRDERLSSVAATNTLHAMGKKVGQDKGAVDRLAAVYILQGYLDSNS